MTENVLLIAMICVTNISTLLNVMFLITRDYSTFINTT